MLMKVQSYLRCARIITKSSFLRHVNFYSSQPIQNFSEITLQNENFQKYLRELRSEFYAQSVGGNPKLFSRCNQMNKVVTIFEKCLVLNGNLISQEDLTTEKDKDMYELMLEENKIYKELLEQTEHELITQLLLLEDNEFSSSVVFEVNAGAGGQEAMMFAKDLFDMYVHYFDFKGWDYDILVKDLTDIGGLRHGQILIDDLTAYNTLRFEAGVHRVQRVPSTEKYGRVHTSTASITVVPGMEESDYSLEEKDLKVETKRASGAGGQHVNSTDSAVRVVHLPTGIAIENQTDRSQLKNRELAIKRLRAKLVQDQQKKCADKKIATRKEQQGNLNRNEKIRTYNFAQDRITDHRIPNGTAYDLETFLRGGQQLDEFIHLILTENRKVKLLENIKKCTK